MSVLRKLTPYPGDEALRERGAAVCVVDTDKGGESDLPAWADRIAAQLLERAYV